MPEERNNVPPFLMPIYQNDPFLYDLVSKGMQGCLPQEGAIPLKYRLLLSMVADGVLFHPEGVTAMAESARQAGATEAEINEAVRVIYLSGGMVALINSLGAYKSEFYPCRNRSGRFLVVFGCAGMKINVEIC